MGSIFRKLIIGLISLAVLLAVYLLYIQINEPAQIDTEGTKQLSEIIADSNVGDFEGEIGKIENIGVAALKRPRYLHRNKNKQVDRELGFEELLKEEKGSWEVSKPYLNIYQSSFKSYITAERGKIQIETVVGRPSPKDITFAGNVIVQIVPEKDSDFQEAFIYLDDIVFISEKSLFSTAGPVKFVSKNAQMLGTGLEFVYDDGRKRLEYFRIHQLQGLRLKIPDNFYSPGFQMQNADLLDERNQQTQQLKETPAPQQTEELQKQGLRQTSVDYYKCIFSKNVVIDAPEQYIFAPEQVSINDILWSAGTDDQADDVDTIAKNIGNTSVNTELSPDKINGTTSSDINTEKNGSTLKSVEPNEKQSKLADTVIKCENGVLVVPMNYSSAINDSSGLGIVTTDVENQKPERFDDVGDRTKFTAEKIDYSLLTGDTIAKGPIELIFRIKDKVRPNNDEQTIPVKVTAQKQARFINALQRINFEEDCLCKMLRQYSNIEQKVTLSAPKLTIDLSKGKNEQDSEAYIDIEHITADGGLVKLVTVKTAKEKSLGGVELQCIRLDYDPNQQVFIAKGPGIIKLDNSKISVSDSEPNQFSLRRPCYAFLRDFGRLEYHLGKHQITADASPEGALRIDYIPIVGGEYGQQIIATAGHIEIYLMQTDDNQNEISRIIATKNITYEDGNNQFAGNKLVYEHSTSVVQIYGDESRPCLLNGALVDGIEIDLRTGKVHAQIPVPGVLQIR